MFSSLASFLFGSSTSASTNCIPSKSSELVKEETNFVCDHNQLKEHSEEGETTKINVPSALNNGELQVIRSTARNKNKRNNKKNKNGKQLPPTEAKQLLIKKPSSTEEDFDSEENDWYFVEKEEEDSNASRDNKRTSTPVPESISRAQTDDLHQKHFQNNALNSQPKNCQKHTRIANECNIEISRRGKENAKTLSDADIAESLYIAPERENSGHNVSSASCDSNGSGAKLFTMVDSWYLTPPPCFTSDGPIHMEVSPLENLLIEHPSMSVYHSIRSMQKATESFVNFDLKENELSQIQKHPQVVKISQISKQKEKENVKPLTSSKTIVLNTNPSKAVIYRNTQFVAKEHAPNPRVDRCAAAQLKMELFGWNSQKCIVIRERRNLRRNAILRANQVREIQGRGNRQRRSDLQNCRLISGVNNNRKCCY
ncbi:PREDICTED: uncharacterized protein LOC108368340 isoform X1 [Rhagoletis zephyria]|uniref:uncharacterized protein LOC108368340 isoform X1 n=1 Tax=Rhagoletis zephyria TaxID=28612 RepID=UPI0008115B2F|nr:PREDICTED: uncharacterized protein LOC108368340 isoform X1 [Rhagoletis zephyria]